MKQEDKQEKMLQQAEQFGAENEAIAQAKECFKCYEDFKKEKEEAIKLRDKEWIETGDRWFGSMELWQKVKSEMGIGYENT